MKKTLLMVALAMLTMMSGYDTNLKHVSNTIKSKNNMKKYVIAALLCIGLFSACERLIYINGDPGADPVMGVDLSFLHVPAEGDSAISINISIYTPVEGGVVTAEADREWITIKELTNEQAIVAVAPNTADTTRYGQITFSYNNEECIGLSVGQEGREEK